MTFKNRLLVMEWWFYEKGGQSIFNELMRAAESTLGSGFTGKPGGVTLLGDIDLANATHLSATANVAGTGAPIQSGVNQPGWDFGQQQIPGTNVRPPTIDQP
jgi:hypothetical protein